MAVGISVDKLAAFNSGAECNKHINKLEVGIKPVKNYSLRNLMLFPVQMSYKLTKLGGSF